MRSECVEDCRLGFGSSGRIDCCLKRLTFSSEVKACDSRPRIVMTPAWVTPRLTTNLRRTYLGVMYRNAARSQEQEVIILAPVGKQKVASVVLKS